jgi:hypothetical protein
MRGFSLFWLRTFLALAGVVLVSIALSPANTLDRDRDPLVLTGSSIPTLLGADPSSIIAFRYDVGWAQIPVQVDERAVVDFGTIYNTDSSGYTVRTYTDTSTFTGPDLDPTFDSDDELVLMVKDAAQRATATSEPPGVIPGTGVELAITHGLTPDSAYAYLFESDGSLDPGAGASRVSYTFNLLSGDYKTTYNTMAGPNPEDSEVTTSAYTVHFSDRWIRHETSVTKDGASGLDILDRHRSLFAPGNCTRSEDTFSAGEGAFIVNREGPVRALRGYVGANSGPTTYRIHAFYEEREDVLTALRVHAISGIVDFFDYSPQAVGMTFYDDLNTGGAPIDGVPEAVTPGEFTWEMVTGPQGTLVITILLNTDIPGFDYSSYYCDDSTPPETQCTGDAYEYGASGLWEQDPIPNTDPALGAYNIFEATRVNAYGGPNQGVTFAETCAAQALNPLTTTATPYVPDPAAGIKDGTPVSETSRMRVAIDGHPVTENLRLRIRLPAANTVSIRLYDVAGRACGTLEKGHWPAGEHEITRDISQLPAGIYFIRVTGPDGTGPTFRIVHIQ